MLMARPPSAQARAVRIAAAIARYLDGTPAFIGYSELYWLSDENGTWQLKGHYHGA